MNQCLKADEMLMSQNKKYRAVMQRDGNFVQYYGSIEASNAIWASNTDRKRSQPHELWMQNDCHLVLYSDSRPTWTSKFYIKGFKGKVKLVMQNDGNLVKYVNG